MSFTGLVTDSTASIPPEVVQQYGIRVVPLYVKIGETSYRDGVDMTAGEFYQRLPKSNPLPTTSQPSAGDFATVYQELIEQGASSIISVHISGGISGTTNSANLAAQQVKDVPIEIIDTRCAAAGHLLTVEATAKVLAAGASFAEAVHVAQTVVERQRTIFSLDTLEYLYKGGRIGGAAALVGSLLQFKPLLYFKDGKIDVLERVRRSSRAMPRMVEVMADWLGAQGPLEAVAMHAVAPDRAQELAELSQKQLNTAHVRLSLLTPVIGTHAGPGTLGLCCCPVAAMR